MISVCVALAMQSSIVKQWLLLGVIHSSNMLFLLKVMSLGKESESDDLLQTVIIFFS